MSIFPQFLLNVLFLFQDPIQETKLYFAYVSLGSLSLAVIISQTVFYTMSLGWDLMFSHYQLRLTDLGQGKKTTVENSNFHHIISSLSSMNIIHHLHHYCF